MVCSGSLSLSLSLSLSVFFYLPLSSLFLFLSLSLSDFPSSLSFYIVTYSILKIAPGQPLAMAFQNIDLFEFIRVTR